MTKKYDILIIDDEQVILDSIVKICHDENLEIATAIDATAGLEIITNNTCRLVICDIMLPDMNGFDFLQQLKLKQIELPVVMTSGYSTIENAVMSLSRGAIDYLSKPFTSDELLSTIFRAFKYIEIQSSLSDYDFTKKGNALPYVPCPHKYYRLGYYSWVNIELDGTARIGASDLYLKIIEGIHSLKLFEVDEEVVLGDSCALFESTDGLVHQYLSPLTGRIIDVNSSLSGNKNLIEKDPYFQGWIYAIIPSDLDFEIKHLTHCSSDRI